jgi:O-antigen/teichoic acid export membrane protein
MNDAPRLFPVTPDRAVPVAGPEVRRRTTLSALQISPERLRFWGIRGGISVLDQGLASGASFLLNLMLARWLTTENYGAFAVAFATLLFLSGYHNVLLLEPMTVLGPARYSATMTEYFGAQLMMHGIVATVLSGPTLLVAALMAAFGAQHALVTATAASALALPFLLLFWLVRRMCYVVQRPAIAAWASAGYFVLLVSGLFALHMRGDLSSTTAFLLVAAVSVFAVLVPLHQLGLLRVTGIVASPWKRVAAENWNYGRWLMASITLFSLGNQAQTYLVAALMGLGAAGVLRAMQIPALAMTQVVAATSLVVLPAMSYEFGKGRTKSLKKMAILSTVAVTGLAILYALLLAVFAKPLEHILFRGKFADVAWLIPVLGLVPVCAASWMGFSAALRASQKPQYELVANAVSALVGLITGVILIKFWGIGGAAVSLVASYASIGVVLFWAFHSAQREWDRRWVQH